MAMAMARMAYADGIRGLAVTPHNSSWWNGYFQDKVERLTREFQQRINDASMALQVGPGAEIYMELDILKRLKDGRAGALNHSRYLLVELPGFNSWPLYVEQVFFELQAAGYSPILAHPERYEAVMEKPEKMRTLAERGIIGQITSGSLEGKFGSRVQKTARILLENNWSHFIATDAHDLTNRTPTMKVARQILAANFGEERATLMTEMLPRQIFCNEDVVLESPLHIEATLPRGFLGSLFRR